MKLSTRPFGPYPGDAKQAVREADRAEAEAWSIRMEGCGGPAQPSPTIGQCLNGGLGWLYPLRKMRKSGNVHAM